MTKNLTFDNIDKKGVLRHFRRLYGASQEFLASLLGISRMTYLLVEKGKRELTVSEARIIIDHFSLGKTSIKEPGYQDLVELKEHMEQIKKHVGKLEGAINSIGKL